MATLHGPPVGGQTLPSSSSQLTPDEEDPEPPEPSARPGYIPPLLAIRSDGVVLLSTEEMGDRDLTGRVLWTAVQLTPEEERFVREGAMNKEQELASKLIARFPRKGGAGLS